MNTRTQKVIRFVSILGLLTALTVSMVGCYDSSGYDSDKDPFWWGHNTPLERHPDEEAQIAALGQPSDPQVQDTVAIAPALHPGR